MAKTPLQAAHDHVLPVGVYVKTLIALTILMGLTIWASYIDLPGIGPVQGVVLNNAVALIIASIKAMLVIFFFMHVKYSSSLAKLFVLSGFTFLALMFMILADYGTRRFEPANGWVPGSDSALPRQVGVSDKEPADPDRINLRPRQ